MEKSLCSSLCKGTMLLLAASAVATMAYAQTKPRARNLGVPFEGVPGPLNAITDVAGVRVGPHDLDPWPRRSAGW